MNRHLQGTRRVRPHVYRRRRPKGLPKDPEELPKWAKRTPPTKTERLVVWLKKWDWLLRDGVLAILVGLTVLGVQTKIDDDRAERELQIAAQQNRQAERLENLRFVREHARPNSNINDQGVVLPFAGFDLDNMNLTGLRLSGADFTGASLQSAKLSRTDLSSVQEYGSDPLAFAASADFEGTDSDLAKIAARTIVHLKPRTSLAGANLCSADLTGVDLTFADLRNANLRGANLDSARINKVILYGADLRDANISSAFVDKALWDETTLWPDGFKPPPVPSIPSVTEP